VRLLFDTNVLLDAVLVREPWADDAMAVLEAVEAGRAVGYVAPHGISTFYYFHADYVVTRDLKDFAASPVPAISPADVLRLL